MQFRQYLKYSNLVQEELIIPESFASYDFQNTLGHSHTLVACGQGETGIPCHKAKLPIDRISGSPPASATSGSPSAPGTTTELSLQGWRMTWGAWPWRSEVLQLHTRPLDLRTVDELLCSRQSAPVQVVSR